jgi:putative addiction module killer protein
MNRHTFDQTEEYERWRLEQPVKARLQIAKRLSLVQQEGHFGDHKSVGDNVHELRWENGRRVYYAIIPPQRLILLLGGNKNGQSKDIYRAAKLYQEWLEG